MSLTPQGRVAARLGGGLFALVVLSTALFVATADRRKSTAKPLIGSPVATITFDTATPAWVSTTGTKALYQDGAQWTLGTYGYGGQTDVAKVDEVSVLSDHQVYEFTDPPMLVIDETEYTLRAGTYVSGDCHWCKVPFPDQPVLADLHDGTWKLTLGQKLDSIDQPGGWNGRPPAAGLDPAGKVVIVASLGAKGTAVIEGSHVCTVDGNWTLVAAQSDRILLHKVDPAQQDYSVIAVNRCT